MPSKKGRHCSPQQLAIELTMMFRTFVVSIYISHTFRDAYSENRIHLNTSMPLNVCMKSLLLFYLHVDPFTTHSFVRTIAGPTEQMY